MSMAGTILYSLSRVGWVSLEPYYLVLVELDE